MLTTSIFFSNKHKKKCERKFTCNIEPTLKVNSDDRSICYERLKTLKFQNHQA